MSTVTLKYMPRKVPLSLTIQQSLSQDLTHIVMQLASIGILLAKLKYKSVFQTATKFYLVTLRKASQNSMATPKHFTNSH